MRHGFILVVMLFTTVTARPAAATTPDEVGLFIGTPVDWKVGELAGQYFYSDEQGHRWTVKLKPGDKVDGKPQSVNMTVSADGIQPASLSIDISDSDDNGTLAVYNFDAGLPTFLTTHYTNGAHCCYDVQAVVFNGKTLVATDVDSYDGGVDVRDIDGDGTYEIDTIDQRFLYAFDGYDWSRAAREIDKVRDRDTVAVTSDPQYQPYLMAELDRELAECDADPGPGMCAGPLGTAAVLGIYQSAAANVPFEKIDNNKGASYLTCSKDDCGKAIKFQNYRQALEYRLKDWGYNTSSSLNDKGRAFLRRFAAFTKGFGAPALPCGKDAFQVRLDKNEQFAEIGTPGHICRVEKINVLENAAIALGFCSMTTSSSLLIAMELDGDELSMSMIDKGVLDAKSAPGTIKACR